MRTALAAAVAGTLVAAGCLGDDEGGPPSALVERDQARAASVPITGATSGQRRLLRSILAGMGRTRISRIELSDARGRWPDGDVVALRTARGDLRADWEAHLVGGIFRDRSLEQGLPNVAVVASWSGASTTARSKPDARFRPFDADDAAAVVSGIERAAKRGGAELERVELLQPEGLAVAARLRVTRPGRFLSERLDTVFEDLDGDTARYEGRYLEIVDRRGRPVLKEFGVSRLHWGGGGPVDRRYAGCVFLGIAPAVGYEPPSCPVDE